MSSTTSGYGRIQEVMRLLMMSKDYVDPNPGRDHINGLEHALRCAGLGANQDQETSFIGLVHDLARPLSEVHHGEVMAEIVRDRISERGYNILRTHGEYQSAIMHGYDLPAHSWQRDAMRFAGYEMRSFSPKGVEISIEQAENMIKRWLS